MIGFNKFKIFFIFLYEDRDFLQAREEHIGNLNCMQFSFLPI